MQRLRFVSDQPLLAYSCCRFLRKPETKFFRMGNELLAGVGKNVAQTHLDLFGLHLRICDLQAQARCG